MSNVETELALTRQVSPLIDGDQTHVHFHRHDDLVSHAHAHRHVNQRAMDHAHSSMDHPPKLPGGHR